MHVLIQFVDEDLLTPVVVEEVPGEDEKEASPGGKRGMCVVAFLLGLLKNTWQ